MHDFFYFCGSFFFSVLLSRVTIEKTYKIKKKSCARDNRKKKQDQRYKKEVVGTRL